MAELTLFGKEIRKLRIEHGETMMDMAAKLGKSPSFLSSVETGRKAIPQGLVADIGRAYALPQTVVQSLQRAAEASASVFKIAPESRDQELVAAFARKFDSLSDEQRNKMLKILMD